jgi:hypothetical protein
VATARERAHAARRGVVGQADEHELARGRRLPAAVGRDRARSSAQEIALTLTGRRSSAVLPHKGAWASVSVSVSFTPVRDRSPTFTQMMFVQFADGGGRR